MRKKTFTVNTLFDFFDLEKRIYRNLCGIDLLIILFNNDTVWN